MMRRLLFSLLLCHILHAADELPRVNGFVLSGHAWTWGKGTIFEALDASKAAGCSALEVFLMGQKISSETGDVVLDETTPDDVIEKLKAKCAATGIPIINAYIGQKQWTRIGQDEAQLRRFFELGRKLGLRGFTGEPAPAQWDMVEKLVKEFNVTFSIHNHAKGFEAEYFGGPYPYADPAQTVARLNTEKRDARMGICLDTGHVARSGLDVIATAKACAGRILSAHLKDVKRVKLHDVPYGHGMVDIPATLAVLRQEPRLSHIALEYEWFESPTFATDVRTLVEFIRDHKTAAFPAPKLPDMSGKGRYIQRTMRLLAESTPEHRNTVRILFYGQSITAQDWTKSVAADLRARFPHANLVIENRALGGFASQHLVRCVETDVVSFQPDLLIFHVFGSHDKYEDILSTVRQRTTAEILQQNDHLKATSDLDENTDPAHNPPNGKRWDGFMNFNWLPKLSVKYETEFCDQRAIWKQYLRDNKLAPQALLKDQVHLNEHGNFLMAEIVKAHLRHDPQLDPSPAEAWVAARKSCSSPTHVRSSSLSRTPKWFLSALPAEIRSPNMRHLSLSLFTLLLGSCGEQAAKTAPSEAKIAATKPVNTAPTPNEEPDEKLEPPPEPETPALTAGQQRTLDAWTRRGSDWESLCRVPEFKERHYTVFNSLLRDGAWKMRPKEAASLARKMQGEEHATPENTAVQFDFKAIFNSEKEALAYATALASEDRRAVEDYYITRMWTLAAESHFNPDTTITAGLKPMEMTPQIKRALEQRDNASQN
jgi:sugar phosphate isomerase/epimerase